MKTGLITSDTYQNHNTGDGHPEKIDRVTVVIDNLKKLDNKDLVWKKPSKFDRSLLEITHNLDYINFVEKSFPEKGLSFLDGDTIVSPGSKDATSDAVGSIITAIDGVQNKNFSNAFCAVRPPGHHAEKNINYKNSVEEAIRSIDLQENDIILITGSLYLAGEVLNLN
ncbi:hypothetical protein N8897_00520 [Candidatus Pelagibacter sp.]|nr:hypothetical protein [Candidatus Pelagibacter sp.]